MPLVLNEEQQMLKDSSREFLKTNADVSVLRSLRDEKDLKGYSDAAWNQMKEMGWSALAIPEAYGGLGFGYTGLGQILEETGRSLSNSPLISNVLLAASIINESGNEKLKESLLPAIADGNKVFSVAIEESNGHRPYICETDITSSSTGAVISGKKKFVLNGHTADHLIVSAQNADGMYLYIVDANASGVVRNKKRMMDDRYVCEIDFQDVSVGDEHMLCGPENSLQALEKGLDIGRIGISAEMLGIMQESFDRTMSYLKERVQFGKSIGTFQALQHRAADMFCEIELCKSLVLKSLQAIDEGVEDLAPYASMTKAKVGEILQHVTNECVQLYGGIGVTDDEEIGFYMKRARVAQQTFGDYSYHVERFARINGF